MNPLVVHTYNVVNMTHKPIISMLEGIFMFRANQIANPQILSELLVPLDMIEREIDHLMQSETPIHVCVFWIIQFYTTAVRAECYRLVGCKSMALKVAKQFLDFAKRAGKYYLTFALPLIQEVMEMVIDILTINHEFKLVKSFLSLIEDKIPSCAAIRDGYMAKVIVAEKALHQWQYQRHHQHLEESGAPASSNSDNSQLLLLYQQHEAE